MLKQKGVSLFEMLAAMLMLAIAVIGVLQTVSNTTRQTSSTVAMEEATMIARSYVDEILHKQYVSVSSCGALPGSRIDYDTCHYDGLTDGEPEDANGVALSSKTALGSSIISLENYKVTVSVEDSSAWDTDYSITSANLQKITVTVDNADNYPTVLLSPVALTVYKTNVTM